VALTVRKQVRLLVALAGPAAAFSVVAAQAEVGKKTNEVLMATVVPGQIDLNNKIVTADALHTVRATANHDLGTAVAMVTGGYLWTLPTAIDLGTHRSAPATKRTPKQ
jgi:hypothetical protein